MARKWRYEYSSHEIVVKNSAAGEALYVDEKLQDLKRGLTSRSELHGKLPSGEEIKATLGGIFVMHCDLFIDNKYQTPIVK